MGEPTTPRPPPPPQPPTQRSPGTGLVIAVAIGVVMVLLVALGIGAAIVAEDPEGRTAGSTMPVGPTTGGPTAGIDQQSATIGPAGGDLTATAPDGSSVLLSVPADALDHPTEITVTLEPADDRVTAPQVAALAAGVFPAGDPLGADLELPDPLFGPGLVAASGLTPGVQVRFEPSGTRFAVPAALTVAGPGLAAGSPSDETLAILLLEADDGTTSLADVAAVADASVTLLLEHFTVGLIATGVVLTVPVAAACASLLGLSPCRKVTSWAKVGTRIATNPWAVPDDDELRRAVQPNLRRMDRIENAMLAQVCHGGHDAIHVDVAALPSWFEMIDDFGLNGDSIVEDRYGAELQMTDYLVSAYEQYRDGARGPVTLEEILAVALPLAGNDLFWALALSHAATRQGAADLRRANRAGARPLPSTHYLEAVQAPRPSGDQVGAIYHSFGMAAYGVAYRAVTAAGEASTWFRPPSRIADYEEQWFSGNNWFSGDSDMLELAINKWAGRVGSELYRAVTDGDPCNTPELPHPWPGSTTTTTTTSQPVGPPSGCPEDSDVPRPDFCDYNDPPDLGD